MSRFEQVALAIEIARAHLAGQGSFQANDLQTGGTRAARPLSRASGGTGGVICVAFHPDSATSAAFVVDVDVDAGQVIHVRECQPIVPPPREGKPAAA